MIRLEDLTKRYGDFLAVDRLNLTVEAGELFGFLGPNGAGKTTTIKMMAGLLRPTAGRVLLAGYDLVTEPSRAKAVLGFIPDRPFLYDKLTAEELLRFVAGLYGVDGPGLGRRVDELLALVEIAEWKKELVEGFSHGMKQRLVLAAAFIHDPPVLVVDEPMVGLDPKGARLIKDLFRQRCRRGQTVFMSTHTLEVAEEMCDRIGVILGGRLVALGTMEELRRQAGSDQGRLEPVFLRLTGREGFKESEAV
jgi:ABC-2 type transport system ATP-binding protein